MLASGILYTLCPPTSLEVKTLGRELWNCLKLGVVGDGTPDRHPSFIVCLHSVHGPHAVLGREPFSMHVDCYYVF